MAEVPPPPAHSPSPPRPAAPANGIEDSGQWPVLKVDLRKSVRFLTLQNVVLFIGLLGVGWGVGNKVAGWVVGDAIAADPRFQDHERRIARNETGQAYLERLAIRQLEEGRANAEYQRTGEKSAVLQEPLPKLQLQLDGGL